MNTNDYSIITIYKVYGGYIGNNYFISKKEAMKFIDSHPDDYTCCCQDSMCTCKPQYIIEPKDAIIILNKDVYLIEQVKIKDR